MNDAQRVAWYDSPAFKLVDARAEIERLTSRMTQAENNYGDIHKEWLDAEARAKAAELLVSRVYTRMGWGEKDASFGDDLWELVSDMARLEIHGAAQENPDA